MPELSGIHELAMKGRFHQRFAMCFKAWSVMPATNACSNQTSV